ncbi:MAG: membrane protein insertase YidC [Candidatus Omnitrophica bacterium]|nr:membrane protein insertase YidC [Candidatus Omnitrophota bacterium]
MDKRLIQVFFITFIFLLLWSYMFPQKPPQPLNKDKQLNDLEEETISIEPSGSRQQDFTDDLVPQEELPKAEINNLFITYSPTGGYIKSISFGPTSSTLNFQDIGITVEDLKVDFNTEVKDNSIAFSSASGLTKQFIFKENSLEINLNQPRESILVFSNNLDPEIMNQRYQELFYLQGSSSINRKYFSDRFLGIFGKGAKEEILNDIKFAGGRDRYYTLSLIPDEYKIEWKKQQQTTQIKDRQIKSLNIQLILLNPSKSILLYLGPQKTSFLKPYGLEGIINYGVFHIIGIFMVKVLNLLYQLTHNWGASIIIFSAMIYFLLFPFTFKSMQAMRKIQQLQPELNALKEKYKDNPQKFQKESIEFYRKHKINPASGCLPMFFQMPVFIALYQVIFRLYDLKEAKFLWIKDLSLPDRLSKLPFTLPLLNTDYFNLLPILVMILGFFQQKISSAGTPAKADAAAQQRSMGLFMTVFIGFIFYGFPSALVLYWFTQNIFTLLFHSRMSKQRLA